MANDSSSSLTAGDPLPCNVCGQYHFGPCTYTQPVINTPFCSYCGTYHFGACTFTYKTNWNWKDCSADPQPTKIVEIYEDGKLIRKEYYYG